MVRLRLILVATAFALLLFSAVAPRFNADLRAYQARQWLRVPCEIVASHVEQLPGEDRYRFELRYRYDLGGQILRSSRFSFGPPPSGSRSAMVALADRYPVGALSTCRVNPGIPAQAVLDAGFVTPGWLMVLAASLILAVAIGLAGLLERLLSRVTGANRPQGPVR